MSLGVLDGVRPWLGGWNTDVLGGVDSTGNVLSPAPGAPSVLADFKILLRS